MKYIALVAVLTVAAEGFSALGSREILLHDGEGNLINGANAYACYYDEYRVPTNAINGSGLILKEDGTYSCGTDKTTLWMGAGDDKKFSNWFLVDLGREEYLDRIDLWNCNLKLGDTVYVNRGVKTLAVWTSTNELATNSLPFKSGGSLDNCMAPLGTSDANNFDWGKNNEKLDQTVWTLRANGEKVGELSQASGDENYSTPHEIRLAPGRARWVLLKIGDLFQSEYGSISELQFFYEDYCSVQTLSPEAIKVNSAVLSAELKLKDGVEAGDVVLVYGKTQGGETVESWENSVTNFNALAGKTTFSIEDLEAETTYFYKFFAVDKDHGDVPVLSEVNSFKTISKKYPYINAVAEPNASSATVSGGLLDAGSDGLEVFVVYGKRNGGNDIDAWEIKKSLGVKQIGDFSVELLNLDPDSEYYYAFYVQEDSEFLWSEVLSFETKKNYSIASFSVERVTEDKASFNVSTRSESGASGQFVLAYGTVTGGDTPESWEYKAQREIASDTERIELENLPQDNFYAVLFTPEGLFSEAVEFSTGAVAVSGPDDFFEGNKLDKYIVFTRPQICADKTLTVAYSLDGSVADKLSQALSGEVVFEEGVFAVTNIINASMVGDIAEDQTLTIKLVSSPFYPMSGSGECSFTVFCTESHPGTELSWTGNGGDLNWTTAQNWTEEKIPTMLDDVVLSLAGSLESPVRVTAAGAQANKLKIGTAEGEAYLTLEDNSNMYLNSDLLVGEGSTGSLNLDESEIRSFGSVTIGNAANGEVKIGNGAKFNSAGRLRMAIGASSNASMLIDGGSVWLDNSDQPIIGEDGTARIVVKNGSFGIRNQGDRPTPVFAKNIGSRSELVVDNGTVSDLGYSVIFGDKGEAKVLLKSGSIHCNREIVFGRSAEGIGILTIEGGVFDNGSRAVVTFAESGSAVIKVCNGAVFRPLRGFRLAVNEGSFAQMEIYAASISEGNDGSGSGFTVGGAGKADLYMHGDGARLSSPKKNMSIGVLGCFHGDGVVNFGSKSEAHFTNNGVVRWEGVGETVKTLQMNADGKNLKIFNTIENTRTNGWYAIGNSRLTFGAQTVLAGTLDEASGVRAKSVFCWGESADDEEIDLVNSIRFVFDSLEANGTLTGMLLSADMSEVKENPPNGEIAAVWDFSFNRQSAAKIEFRYDHQKAPKGVRILKWSDNASKWEKVATSLLPGFRAAIFAEDVSGRYAAVAQNPGLIITVR